MFACDNSTCISWDHVCNLQSDCDNGRDEDPVLCGELNFRLTLNAPIATKVVCFSRLLKCLRTPFALILNSSVMFGNYLQQTTSRSLYGKQCGPRTDCSYRSSLFWVHAVYFCTKFVSNVRQLFAADDFSRQHFQIAFFFLGTLTATMWRRGRCVICCVRLSTVLTLSLKLIYHNHGS